MTGLTPQADVLEQILAERFSCRGFRSEPVPAAVQRRMFAMAQRTASWCNSQAWQVHVAPDTELFAKALTTRVLSSGEAPDIPGPASYEGVYQDRRRACGFALYEAVGVERSDQEGRLHQMLENFRFFGAPHVAVISTPKALGVYGAVDCGGYVSTLLAAAQSLGVSAIAQAAVAMYADVVHEHLGIPSDRDIVCAVSYGFADPDHPANAFRTERAPLPEAVSGDLGL